jgi:hypothetical protein
VEQKKAIVLQLITFNVSFDPYDIYDIAENSKTRIVSIIMMIVISKHQVDQIYQKYLHITLIMRIK